MKDEIDLIRRTLTSRDLLDAIGEGYGDPEALAEALMTINTTTDKAKQVEAAYQAAERVLDITYEYAVSIYEFRRGESIQEIAHQNMGGR